MATPTKKRPNKQHSVKGSSWVSFAKALETAWSPDMSTHELCQLIIATAKKEGQRVRGLR